MIKTAPRILLSVLIAIACFSVFAQDSAALLEVTSEQVEVLRLQASNWISLRFGAQTPVGRGDQIHTDSYGRAFIRFDSGHTLIMPDSRVTITEYSPEILTFSLTAGRMIFAFDQVDSLDFQLQAGRVTIDEPSPSFAVQVMDNIVWVISADEILSGTLDGTAFAVAAGEGVRASDTLERVAMQDGMQSFARIDGLLDGCPGVVQARGESSLNVRIGPSTAYDVLGSIADNLDVFLMATNPDNGRYRIQFLNGFGWILATAVDHHCTNLPVLPYSAAESPLRVVRASAEELAFLQPFFGAPEDDLIFYILPHTAD